MPPAPSNANAIPDPGAMEVDPGLLPIGLVALFSVAKRSLDPSATRHSPQSRQFTLELEL